MAESKKPYGVQPAAIQSKNSVVAKPISANPVSIVAKAQAQAQVKESTRIASPISASGGDRFGAVNFGGKWGGKMPLIVGGGLAAVFVLVWLFGGRRGR
jgi:hypothetical protein